MFKFNNYLLTYICLFSLLIHDIKIHITHKYFINIFFRVDFMQDLGKFYQSIKIGSKEHEHIKLVTKLWTNFAKYGYVPTTLAKHFLFYFVILF